MRFLGLLLAIGDRYKVSDSFLVGFGIAVIVFGLLAESFFTDFPTLRGIVRKLLPRWFGRLWLVGAETLLIYWGVTRGL